MKVILIKCDILGLYTHGMGFHDPGNGKRWYSFFKELREQRAIGNRPITVWRVMKPDTAKEIPRLVSHGGVITLNPSGFESCIRMVVEDVAQDNTVTELRFILNMLCHSMAGEVVYNLHHRIHDMGRLW